MAILAEVGVAPAEPLGDRATKLAFKFDELRSMDLALVLTYTQLLCCARTAHKVLWFKLLLFLLGSNTVLHASEIGFVACKAKVISALENCEFLQVSVIGLFKQSWIFVKPFDLCLNDSFLLHISLESVNFDQKCA